MQGRYTNTPREQRLGRHCPSHVGDEKHLISECTAFQVLCLKFSHMFEHQSVRTFMNQDSQKGVLRFICDCLAYDSLLADTLGEDVA